MRVVTWNGRNIPSELRSLPPGKYAVESIDRLPVLTEKEEAGLEAAITSLKSGRGIPAADVHSELRSRVGQARGGRKRRRG
jgi:hypothetical protein